MYNSWEDSQNSLFVSSNSYTSSQWSVARTIWRYLGMAVITATKQSLVLLLKINSMKLHVNNLYDFRSNSNQLTNTSALWFHISVTNLSGIRLSVSLNIWKIYTCSWILNQKYKIGSRGSTLNRNQISLKKTCSHCVVS